MPDALIIRRVSNCDNVFNTIKFLYVDSSWKRLPLEDKSFAIWRSTSFHFSFEIFEDLLVIYHGLRIHFLKNLSSYSFVIVCHGALL